MPVQLVIFDGKEAGVEVSLDKDTIFSIGSEDNSDFFLPGKDKGFNVFFNALDTEVEWWSQIPIDISILGGKKYQLSLEKTALPFNQIIEIAGRKIGLFTNRDNITQSLQKFRQQEPAEDTIGNEDESTIDTTPSIESLANSTAAHTPDDTMDDESDRINTNAHEDMAPSDDSASQNSTNAPRETLFEALSQLEDPALEEEPFDRVLPKRPDRKIPTRIPETQTRGLLYYGLRVAPFFLGGVILIGYFLVQKPTLNQQLPIQQEEHRRQENKPVGKNNDNTKLFGTGEISRDESQFIASGIEQGEQIDPLFMVQGVERTALADMEELRQNLSQKDPDIDRAKEVLFPDEKMMTLIREMLDMAGAQGIDVRFDRGNYEVVGYVKDDAKWSRIYKILTFDLDLSKVRFSVETSLSLVSKLEELLKKFNLSSYVMLSLDAGGGIVARTYYPPALEGLWLTIQRRFLQKYGEYISIQEYRAHVGWINVVKVSFDHPSYVLLSDGRRIVEGSVIGGDSVLDAVLQDALRIKTTSSEVRYYLINKSSRLADASLSDI